MYLFRCLLLPALVAGWLGLAGLAQAGDDLPSNIHDRGKFFSKEAIEKANKRLDRIQRDKGVDVVIDTYPSIPANKEARYKEIREKAKSPREANERFFRQWGRELYKTESVDGVFILICRKPGVVHVEVGNKTTRRGAFSTAAAEALKAAFVKAFQQKKWDEGLEAGLDVLESRLKKPAAATNSSRRGGETSSTGTARTREREKEGSGMGIWGWVCIG